MSRTSSSPLLVPARSELQPSARRPRRRSQRADQADDLVGWTAPELSVQAGRGRIRPDAPERPGECGGKYQRHQNRGRDSRRQRARRRKLVQLLRRRRVLRHRRLDRPGAADEAVGNQRKRHPGRGTELHEVQRDAVRIAAACRRVRSLLQQSAVQGAGITHPPRTISS